MYNEKDQSFYTLAQLTFHNRCVLSLEYLVHRVKTKSSRDAGGDFQKGNASYFNSCGFLFSAATDGKIAVWSLDRTISDWLESQGRQLTKDEDSSLNKDSTHAVGKTLSSTVACKAPDPTNTIQVHQSGINDIALSAIAGK